MSSRNNNNVNISLNRAASGESRRAFGNNLTNVSSRNNNGKTADQHGNLKKRNKISLTVKPQASVRDTQPQPRPQEHEEHRSQPRLQQVESRESLALAPSQHNRQNVHPQEPAPMEGVSRSVSYQYTGRLDDIDKRDENDPLFVTDYVIDMYEYFRTKERAIGEYIEHQPYITGRMRAILVDWLVEVHLKYKLVPDTLYLTVNILDRFMEKHHVERPKLQLVGLTALLIAAKYEEIYPPEISDLEYICDNAYDKSDILKMEELILNKLHYRITVPCAHIFLVRFLKAAHADKKIVQLSFYLLDVTLQSYKLQHFLPSELAAAAVLIARKAAGRNPWSPTLLKYAEYREEDVLPVVKVVLEEKKIASRTLRLRGVDRKYSSSRFGEVARMDLDNLDFGF